MNKKILLLEKTIEEVSYFKSFLPNFGFDVLHVNTENICIDLHSKSFSYVNKELDLDCFDALFVRTYHQMEIVQYLAHFFKNKPIFGLNPLHPSFQNNKVMDTIKLHMEGILVPNTYMNHKPFFKNLVRKNNWGFGGFNVSMAKDNLNPIDVYSEHLQDFISSPTNSDYRILLLDGVSAPFMIERFPNDGEFRTNIHQGGKNSYHTSEHPLFASLSDVAQKAGKILGRPYAGVDLRMNENGEIFFLEVNRTPRLRIDPKFLDVYLLQLQKSFHSYFQ